MIFEEDYFYAGKILKTHGYQGHLLVNFECFTNRDLKEKEPVFLEIDGIHVPFFIESFEPKDENTIIIKFDNLSTDHDAEEFTGCKVFFPEKSKNKKKKSFSIDKLTGFSFEDITTGIKGTIIDIIDIPGNPLLKIKTSLKKEFFTPYHNELVEKINQKEKLLIMKLPEGLI